MRRDDAPSKDTAGEQRRNLQSKAEGLHASALGQTGGALAMQASKTLHKSSGETCNAEQRGQNYVSPGNTQKHAPECTFTYDSGIDNVARHLDLTQVKLNTMGGP